jgi:hypothetical protein
MSGAFSSIVNFTIEQFVRRAGKLAVLTDIESKSESGQLDCPLQFPKHHKRRRKIEASRKLSSYSSLDLLTDENIETIISRSYRDAFNLLSKLNVNVALEKKRRTTMQEVSSFIRGLFQNKFKKVSYDDHEACSSDDEDEDGYNGNLKYNGTGPLEPDEGDSEEEEEFTCSISANGRTQFHGMRVYDSIS